MYPSLAHPYAGNRPNYWETTHRLVFQDYWQYRSGRASTTDEMSICGPIAWQITGSVGRLKLLCPPPYAVISSVGELVVWADAFHFTDNEPDLCPRGVRRGLLQYTVGNLTKLSFSKKFIRFYYQVNLFFNCNFEQLKKTQKVLFCKLLLVSAIRKLCLVTNN